MNAQSQIYLPKLSPINKIIIIITCACYIFDFILSKTGIGFSFASQFGLSASTVMNGHVYTMLTYPLMSHSLMEIILNSLMLWLMASEFESNWGQKRYLKFLLTTVLGGAVIFLCVNFLFFRETAVYFFPLVGLSGLVSSMCLAYAIIYPDRIFSFMMIIPVKAKYFCMILVVISLFQGLSGPTGVGAWGQLGAILASFLFMMVISKKNFKFLASRWNGESHFPNKKKSKAKLSIVKDDQDNPPKYWQ